MIVDNPETVRSLDDWISTGRWFQMSAVAAEPKLVKNIGFAETALVLHRRILDEVAASEDRRSEGFQALRRRLAYSLSVVVAAIPKEGFLFLKELAGMADADVTWICKQNLKKNRLKAKFPQDVAILEKIVS